MDLEVVYADDAIVVLNKPSGLLSVPGRGEDKQDCLSRRVQAQFPDALIVHRLDMATSGLMVMARGATLQRQLNDAFALRRVLKTYEAVVAGLLPPTPQQGQLIALPIAVDWPNRPLRVIDPVLGKPSETRMHLLQSDPVTNTSRVTLEPVTGRSHQLRVHLQAIGHPILGDALYSPPAVAAQAQRLLLHARFLSFTHPKTGTCVAFNCPCDF
jgi:tRNA pseudouridine32 synthase/23S rRNA pseudouridine746 synthase